MEQEEATRIIKVLTDTTEYRLHEIIEAFATKYPYSFREIAKKKYSFVGSMRC